jgi:ribokinase
MTRASAAPLMVLGSLNVDQVLRVSQIAAAGHTVPARGIQWFNGGKGGNQAVAAARVGVAVEMVGAVGDDAGGATLLAGLRAEGIDTRHVAVQPAQASGLACIQVDDDGHNAIAVLEGANATVSPQRIDLMLQSCPSAATRWWLAQLEVPAQTVWHLLGKVHGAGGAMVLNVSPEQAVADAAWPLLHGVIVNEHEAQWLGHMPVQSVEQGLFAAQSLQRRGPRWVAVTLGAQGVCLCAGELGPNPVYQPAQKVPVVDTTGAGDAYAGVLLAGLAQGLPLPMASERAQSAAALCVGRMGAQAALPRLHELPGAPSQR